MENLDNITLSASDTGEVLDPVELWNARMQDLKEREENYRRWKMRKEEELMAQRRHNGFSPPSDYNYTSTPSPKPFLLDKPAPPPYRLIFFLGSLVSASLLYAIFTPTYYLDYFAIVFCPTVVALGLSIHEYYYKIELAKWQELKDRHDKLYGDQSTG